MEFNLKVALGALEGLSSLGFEDKVSAINELRAAIHKQSPFRDQPIDFVRWESHKNISANDYNPNSVAPPEMKLLELSIISDGYTQPIVAWDNDDGSYEVIDGFHRSRVGRESKEVSIKVNGMLPISVVNKDRQGKENRMASTIRHNRARGEHGVDAMSDIVVELTKRKWSDNRIAKELGMEPDEVLRLRQVGGLSEMFADSEFSEAWETE